MLTGRECGACHFRVDEAGKASTRRPGGPFPIKGSVGLAETVPRVVLPGIQRFFMEPIETTVWRMFTTPWSPDACVERMRTMPIEQLAALAVRDRVSSRA